MDIGKIRPGYALDIWLAQSKRVHRFHPIRLKLRIPRAMPAAGGRWIEMTIIFIAQIRARLAG